MPVSALRLPFIRSDIPSTAGLMDSFLPFHNSPVGVRAREGLPITDLEVGDNKPSRQEQMERKEPSKSRRKGKGKEHIVGSRRGSASAKVVRKKAMQWAGRTIYSVNAVMSPATRPVHEQTLPLLLHDALDAPVPRLSDGRDFLPVMHGGEDDYADAFPCLRKVVEEGIRDARAGKGSSPMVSGWSTPELGWSSPSSSNDSSMSPACPLYGLPSSSRLDHAWLSDSYAGDGLGLWMAEHELESTADDLFFRFIKSEEEIES